MASDAFITFAGRVRELRRTHPNISEPALAPTFQRLIEDLLPDLLVPGGLDVVPEFENPGVGRPDIALKRVGQPARAFIELKSLDKPAAPDRWRLAHDRRQFDRFKSLAIWGASNFADFCLLERGEIVGDAAIVPVRALDPATPTARADALVAAHDERPFLDLLRRLAMADVPAARNAEDLAANLAYAARLVKGIITERLLELKDQKLTDQPLQQVRATFRDVLFAHPEAGGYKRFEDDLFASAFAQTLAFGLLLVREGSGHPVDQQAWQRMPAEHPLMRNALQVLTLPGIMEEVGIGFTVMLDTVNSFAPELLAAQPGGRDPILYFYEDFLRVFDPAARERYGVYYTPVEVVRYMTGALDRALRELGTRGLADPEVTVLDPATGTGTFLLGVAERVRAQAAAGGAGMDRLALHDLAGRMYGFELLVGPYAVAHYRLHHTLREPIVPGAPPPPPLPRLGVFLADTLARPGADAPAGALGFVAGGIREERIEANRIKSEQPILAIIGNPPYRRLEENEDETLVGGWMNELWEDLKQPVRDEGWANQLNTFPELSVAFWRWSMWKLFEADGAPGRGVVAFITNRKFLTGKPYAGLRRMMRERFDRIEIVDLRGDVRRGERAGVGSDTGVFNIQVGTCITLAIADGSKPDGALAQVRYVDSWTGAHFSRAAKLGWLSRASADGAVPDMVAVERGQLDDLRPEPFQASGLLPLREMFSFSKSGMKSGNDPVFVALQRDALRVQVSNHLMRRVDPTYHPALERALSYRPLDVRVLYNDLPLLNRPGPEMQRAWGNDNVGLYAMPFGTGAGPSIWCHRFMPDYHSFSGRGGYAFPLYDRRAGQNPVNLSPALLVGLTAAYGAPPSPEDVFDAILALLSATSYTLRFAEDLEDVFPHVPFPADPAVFARAAAVGREIRAVETFARAPADLDGLSQLETPPSPGPLAGVGWDEGRLTLRDDDTGVLSGVPRAVWDFAVSGYRVLPRWLAAREGQPVDLALVAAIRDLIARIAELLTLFDRADAVLVDALGDTLGRERLGLCDAPVQEASDDDSD